MYIGKCRYEIQEQRKFRYGIPVYTGPLQALGTDRCSNKNTQDRGRLCRMRINLNLWGQTFSA
jgi:hypothetical protein